MRRETIRQGSTLFSRFGTQFLVDAVLWCVAIVASTFFRYEFESENISWLPLSALCLVIVVLQLVLGWSFWLYRGRFMYGSFDEVRCLLQSAFSVAFFTGIPVVIWGYYFQVPRSIVFIALPVALLMMGLIRCVKRLFIERRSRPSAGGERTLVYGAGYVGDLLIRRMRTDRYSPYLPVGFIDDNPKKKNMQSCGVSVRGTGANLVAIAEESRATMLIIAIASADSVFLRNVTDRAAAAGLSVRVLPTLKEMIDNKSGFSDVRDIAIEDLIGRHPVDTDTKSIAGYLQGKRVLVTGAGGSIGSELCQQLTQYALAELIMLDRDETGLQETQISIAGHGLLTTNDAVLADIRDAEAVRAIFVDRKPEVVFHAAALKHLPILERYPDEAWKTNVLGTLNVINAARAIDVQTFVNISTDKAANPTSVLGRSKRTAEQLTAWAAQETGQKYLSVRFGNVIGSRGSMLPTFEALIRANKPLTVTHPDVTRFFMTIPEACQLVVQAGGIGRPREVLTLDMGEPVRILDVAQRMIAQSGKQIEIIFTGLRQGEKLHEELIGEGELHESPFHPRISHTMIGSLNPLHLDPLTITPHDPAFLTLQNSLSFTPQDAPIRTHDENGSEKILGRGLEHVL